jgi:pimeloyl-ACP methyl ester carboxylesterase
MENEAVLIHGWDPEFYNSNVKPHEEDSIAWKKRTRLLNLLRRNFTLKFYDLPGFCGVPEPGKKSFNIEDFSDSFALWLKRKARNPNLIIGYSFGGVVALDHKIRYHDQTPIVLISPALLRNKSAFSKVGHALSALSFLPLSDDARSAYIALFSRYYRLGTPFIRKSYDKIVEKDSSALLDSVNSGEILLIYGRKDTSTSWNLVKGIIRKNKLDYVLIRNGGHNIGESHPQIIASAIEAFTKGTK